MSYNNHTGFSNEKSFDLSIIIPVEFHRGQAIACIHGWTQEQSYPADQYEIILSAPNTIDIELEAEIRALLRPWDRLEKFSHNHDMALVSAAADLAKSSLLLFTESHCIPKHNAISVMLTDALEHPECSGFSFQTLPITHNLISEIEAEIYDTHIQKVLELSDWQKVVDQCFLIRRDAYYATKGFRSLFGHFAEWLLAAEMHRLGKVMGIYSKNLISHYYTGDLTELETFTLDFSKGQIKYLAEFKNEATSRYFADIPVLQEYLQRSKKDYRLIAQAKTIGLFANFINFLKSLKNSKPYSPMLPLLEDWFESILKAYSMRLLKLWLRLKVLLAKHRLKNAIVRENRALAKSEFIDWFAKLTDLARLQYLLDAPFLQNSATKSADFALSGLLDFNSSPEASIVLEYLDFYDSEEKEVGYFFRWSKPTASIWLPLFEGKYQITIQLDKVRPIHYSELLNASFNGCKINNNLISISDDKLRVTVTCKNKDWHQLIWSVSPFLANGDRRLLGLAITSINWAPID
jgi:hypothetical protein